MDNTWNITRNPDKFDESLKAKSFCSEYLLFGEETANKIGHHIPDGCVPNIENNDFNKDIIDCKIKKLSNITDFANYEEPVFKSKIQR